MFNRITRNITGLIAWMIVVIGCIVLNGIVVLSNYLGCKASFELLSYEMRPLHTDELLGGFFGSFFSEATMAHLFAMTVTLTVAFGLILLFHLMFSVYELCYDRRAYIAAGDEESAKIALRLIVRDLILIAIFAIPVFYAAKWDIGLFRYRSVAGALGIEAPQLATSTVKSWELQLEEQGHLFAWSLARFGAWGYIAVTAIACLGMEFSSVKTGEKWSQLCNACGELLHPKRDHQEQSFYGYDSDGQPVYTPDTPIAYDTDGNSVTDYDEVAPDDTDENENVTQPATEYISMDSTNRNKPSDTPLFNTMQVDSRKMDQGGSTESITLDRAHTNSDHEQRETPDTTAPSSADDDLCEVIGYDKGERVSLATALADPQRYWVDPEKHEIWDANFRKVLLEDENRHAA